MQFRYICHLHLPCIVIFPVVPWFQNIGCLQGMSGGLCQEDSLCASCGVWRAIHWNLHLHRAGQRFTRLDRLPLGLIRSMVNLSHMGLFNQPECDVFCFFAIKYWDLTNGEIYCDLMLIFVGRKSTMLMIMVKRTTSKSHYFRLLNYYCSSRQMDGYQESGGLHVRNWDTMHQNTLGLPKIGYLLQVMPMY